MCHFSTKSQPRSYYQHIQNSHLGNLWISSNLKFIQTEYFKIIKKIYRKFENFLCRKGSFLHKDSRTVEFVFF
jgi:hypothetical protein